MGGGVSLYHMTVAAKTGFVSSCGVMVTSYLPEAYRTPISNITFTFFTTFIGDILVVPTHYGPVWMEALVTGSLASLFAAMFYGVRRLINK